MTDDQEHNEQIQDTESLDQGFRTVVKTLGKLFTGLRVLIVVLIISFFFGAFFGAKDFGGFFHLEEREQGLLFRFGKFQTVSYQGQEHTVLDSGRLYWRWPYPIDDIKRIKTKEPISLTNTHFWPRKSAEDLKGKRQNFQKGLVPNKDGYLLTGDANIMHTKWKIAYLVRDPKTYYLNFFAEEQRDFEGSESGMAMVNNRRQMIQRLLEQAVLHEAARWSVDELLVLSKRQNMQKPQPSQGKTPQNRAPMQFTNVVKERLQRLVNEVNLGVKIQRVNLDKKQPPNATLRAFNQVDGAAQEYKKRLEAAEEFRARKISQAEGNAAEILSEARSYKSRIVSKVKADKEYFLEVLDEYQKNPQTMLTALYTDTLQDVLKKADSRFIIHDKEDERQEIRVRIGRQSKTASGEK